MTGIAYEDFLDTGYEPRDGELVCAFRVGPASAMEGTQPDEHADDHPELARALATWGTEAPR